MARIRSTHPEQWTDDQFVSCSPLARLLSLGIRNEADDNGVFEWNPVKLKMRILPADNCDVAALLDELVSTNQVHRFEIGGKTYAIIRSFNKFQRPKEPKFYYPTPASLPNGYELNKTYIPTTGEELPQDFGSGGEKSPQRKDVGGKRKEEKNVGADAPSFSPDDLAIAELVWAGVQEIHPTHKPPKVEKWAEAVRLMRERDKREPAEIRAMWIWAHNHDFWRKNILSPDKLREKWDVLVVQRTTDKPKPQAPKVKEFPR